MDLRVRGLENVPRVGGAILVANHPCSLDGHLIMTLVTRPVFAFGRAEIFDRPISRWHFNVMGGIPVQVGGDNREAMQRAEEFLRGGELFIILPESDVYPDTTPHKFHGAFVKLALTCHVPVVPIAIVGSEQTMVEPIRQHRLRHYWLRRATVRVEFMPPIMFDNPTPDRAIFQHDVERVRKLIAQKIKEVVNESTPG